MQTKHKQPFLEPAHFEHRPVRWHELELQQQRQLVIQAAGELAAAQDGPADPRTREPLYSD